MDGEQKGIRLKVVTDGEFFKVVDASTGAPVVGVQSFQVLEAKNTLSARPGVRLVLELTDFEAALEVWGGRPPGDVPVLRRVPPA